MNISYLNKLIWLAQEHSGSDIVREIFKDFDFFSINHKKGEEIDLRFTSESHSMTKIENYSDYSIICSIRNPYDRVWMLFLEMWYPNVAIDKFNHGIFKEKFNYWIKTHFLLEKNDIKIKENIISVNSELDWFNKWNFNKIKPHFFIRFENIQKDLEKLSILQNTIEKYGDVFKNSKYKSKSPLEFNNVYETESARLIYKLYKEHFHLANYDPFSFTKNRLSDNEKITFLHD